MLDTERYELFLIQAVREFQQVILQECLEEFIDSIRSLQLILDQSEQVRRDHNRVPLRLAKKLS